MNKRIHPASDGDRRVRYSTHNEDFYAAFHHDEDAVFLVSLVEKD